ncbi:6-phosphogluconate dehydrogenase [Xylariaceae sp. FL0662B]|nr:6-phosphogluconate dehydrogenase [Xylariaceae sp. FL0662B]
MASLSAKIGILSIGDMGMGIAKLLVANGFSVATNCKGRSNDTLERAKSAQVELLNSDEALTQACSVILSVVPPRDAVGTAQRVIDALTGPVRRSESDPLYFADLNAVAPSTARTLASMFARSRAAVRFVDGSIIGGPPAPKAADDNDHNHGSQTSAWYVPDIPTSGPHELGAIPGFGGPLATALNVRHVAPEIGAASGLKMCFASLSKGFIALAVQSFTTAQRLGVLGELRREMGALAPEAWRRAEKGVVAMPPKAYRWVREMEEIALTFDEDGGFTRDTFSGVAEVYRCVAEDTALGREKIGKRKRGTTVEDVAAAVAEGMQTKRKKNE